MTEKRPIICLDFDGVVHSYTSGWQGAAAIPDPPVPGALEFIVGALDITTVAIFSSRSHQWGGRRAMKRWLRGHLVDAAGATYEDTPRWWQNRIQRTAFADPWRYEVGHAADLVVKEILWPLFKPPAHVSIDDRGFQFVGTWPPLESLLHFRPWNRR